MNLTLTNLLKSSVLLSFLFSITALIFQVLKTFSFGKRHLRSRPQGSREKGIVYAFGRGMMPWEKESAAKHLPTYLAGMLYHAGIFAAAGYVILASLSIGLPEGALQALQTGMAAGLLSGLGLMAKRIIKPHMRAISCPDDFISNLFVDGLILAAFAQIFVPTLLPVLLGTAVVVFLYVPFGKIRHCFFFFYSRVLFGSYFGRRGVFPHGQRLHED